MIENQFYHAALTAEQADDRMSYSGGNGVTSQDGQLLASCVTLAKFLFGSTNPNTDGVIGAFLRRKPRLMAIYAATWFAKHWLVPGLMSNSEGTATFTRLALPQT